jgi:hypothetical protein
MNKDKYLKKQIYGWISKLVSKVLLIAKHR